MYEEERDGGGGEGGEAGGEEEDREMEGEGTEMSLKQELYDVIFRSRLNGNCSLQRNATITLVLL